MKKILLVTFAVMMLASVSFAAWSPVPLVITVQDEIMYDFDGTDVDFTVNVTGKPCKAYLFINTKLADEAKPEMLTNGYLGWHYVNKIDTTVYVSRSYDFSIGAGQTITWDGIGSENTSQAYMGTIEPSEAVAPGAYDYYVWGYDDQNPRDNVCNFIAINFYWYSQYTRVGEWNDDGTPRANPYLWGNVCWMYGNLHGVVVDGAVTGPAEGWSSYGPPRWTAYKFPMGSDPDDMSAMETTFMPGFTDSEGEELDASPILFDPTNEDVFYCLHDYVTQKRGNVFKWNWVSGGNATIDDSWDGHELELDTASERGMGEYYCSSSTDGNYIYMTSPGRDATIKWDKFYTISFDGELLTDQMLDDFYTPDQPEEKYRNGMINRMFSAIDCPNQAVMGGEQHCMMLMAATDRMVNEDAGYVKWYNANGDFFLDASWNPEETDPTVLWECNTGNYKTPNMGRRDEQWFDSNGIVVHHPDFQGLMSVVVYTQDGSGVAYCKFADDTVSMTTADGAKKGSGQRCDNGGQFDGLIIGNVLTETGGYGSGMQSTNWLASDSAAGIITSEGTAVEEEGQAAFSVAAAYPNPANPTTTIGFTLAEAGHVSVDIYNVAGQKVDTLVNSEMSMGNHSVVWNASGFSAGVYFYTVTSGDFSKTMKVTLLK